MVRGPGGLPVAAVTPAVDGAALSAVYYHHDVMGSTVAVTASGSSGASDIYTYGEFGATGAGSWATYRYAGYRYDNETGLYYVNARYYNPNLGRFLQTDPIGLSGGTNLYAYVGNDPINQFDPSGHCAELPSQQQMSAIFGNSTPNVVLGPQLGYTTTSYVAPVGNGYQASYDVAFNVTNNTSAGQIVQQDTFTNSAGTTNLWEVWNVSANGVVTPSAGTIGLNDPLNQVPSNTNDLTYAPSGTTVTQTAAFYPGLQVPTTGPGAFVPGGAQEALGLPSTYTNPNLPNPSLPTTNSSLPVTRTYTF
jgi:RHS repeat-associated protein